MYPHVSFLSFPLAIFLIQLIFIIYNHLHNERILLQSERQSYEGIFPEHQQFVPAFYWEGSVEGILALQRTEIIAIPRRMVEGSKNSQDLPVLSSFGAQWELNESKPGFSFFTPKY